MDYAELQHVFPDTGRVNARGNLEVGGVDVADMAREFGTPLYVFCEETLRGRCRAFQDAFRSVHPDTQVVYAAKAYVGPRPGPAGPGRGAGHGRGVRRRVGRGPERGLPPGVHLFPRQQQVPGGVGAGPRLRRGTDCDRQPAGAGPAGSPGRRPRRDPEHPPPHHARHRPPHPRAHHHGGARQQVRPSPGHGRRRGGHAQGPPLAPSPPGGPPLPPGLSHLRTGALRRRGRRGPGLCRSLPRGGVPDGGVQPRRRLRHRLHPGPAPAEPRRIRADHRGGRAQGVRDLRLPLAEADHRAGPGHLRPRGRVRVHRGRRQGDSRRAHLRRCGRRHGGQHPPRALRRSLRGGGGQSHDGTPRPGRHRRGQVLRVGRHPRPGRPAAAHGAGATSSPCPPRAPTRRPWPATTT